MTKTALLLLVQLFFYFGLMAILLRARHRLGLGAFMAALGVMHFIETYLAAVFYVAMPFGTISPGSSVLFAGKLAMLLLLFMKEDAEAVRQPIYGLLIGNFITVGMVMIARQMDVVSPVPGRVPDLAFIDEMGWLMVWGTLLLYVDAIAVILIYGRLNEKAPSAQFRNAAIALCVVLAFDQAGFYLVLHLLTGAPLSVLVAGWIAKTTSGIIYAALLAFYVRVVEPRQILAFEPLNDVFRKLTFRYRQPGGRDVDGVETLVGLRGRDRLDHIARPLVNNALAHGRQLSVMLLDIDDLVSLVGDEGEAGVQRVLTATGQTIAAGLKSQDRLFRYDRNEFLLLLDETDHQAAVRRASRMARAVHDSLSRRLASHGTISVSCGIASIPGNANDLRGAIRCAAARLDEARRQGGGATIGDDAVAEAGGLPQAG